MKKGFKIPLPLPADLPDMVSYETVLKIFKWADNRSIRRAVRRGELIRVPVGDSTNALITAASVRQYHQDLIDLAEAGEQFDISPGRFEAMRRAKKQRAPVPQVTAELDAREIVRQADNLTQTPTPSVPLPSAAPSPAPQTENEKLGAYMNARGAAKVQAYRALDWRTKNKLIEQGLV